MRNKKKVFLNKIVVVLLAAVALAVILAGCQQEPAEEYTWEEIAGLNEVTSTQDLQEEKESESEIVLTDMPEEESQEISEELSQEESESQEEVTESAEESEAASSESSAKPAEGSGKRIVIDAGHQAKGNSEKEPVGPGATETKAKVTGGATGTTTGQKEYELNLAVAFLLRDELVARGYEVIMVRESNDVNISNSERAAVANNAGADVFIRVHANGSENASASGTETLCQTAQNPYNAALYPASRKLSEKVLAGVVAQTGFKNRGVKETDTMSGINWCTVPTTIVEMGFLSNPDEDSLMYTEEYRRKIAVGIADGIERFFVE
ncbi:MAG: N-acetylmuramoyl-L-alanine amidase [Lachnospiraceae bacterium]|nr:N-acetylmuramoyl-L-alanine amidase [Lachnospiraceae bacterium]